MDMRRGRYNKSLLEDVSIRRPSGSYEEFPDILDKDGNKISSTTADSDTYTFEAKVVRVLPTRRNRDIDENLYEREDAYYVHFCENMEFLTISDEVLWHKHIDCEDGRETPNIAELRDATKGVLTVISVEEHRGNQRIYCQLYDIA